MIMKQLKIQRKVLVVILRMVFVHVVMLVNIIMILLKVSFDDWNSYIAVYSPDVDVTVE